jgi:hypothetical protein
VAFASGFSDQRISSTSWTSIPERSVTHTKLNDVTTIIRVTYMDTLGFATTCHGQGCNWRLLVDGNSVAGTREFWSHGSNSNGYRIYPMKLVFYPSVGTGSHSYAIQTYRGGCASECLAGYPSGSNNLLLIEELDVNKG